MHLYSWQRAIGLRVSLRRFIGVGKRYGPRQGQLRMLRDVNSDVDLRRKRTR
jgi:hypothetical protein